MRRFAQVDLKSWYHRKTRMPLVLRGARQVGKSTLVRLFCQDEELDLLEVNLEKDFLRSVEGEHFNLPDLLDEIQLLKKKKITKKTLIFLDEIQERPKLLKYLRYFYEERPDLAIIVAGSLLEIAMKSENFSFPVGRVEFYHLGPMTFKEFLLATGQELLSEKIDNLEFSPAVESIARESFKKYLYIGGMPKAVATFVEDKSLVEVRKIQDQILQTYMADFPKYNDRMKLDRIQKVFYASALQIGKKVIYQRFDRDSQSREIKRTIELLLDARVLLACCHSDGNSVPLAGEADISVQKLYFLDVGLLNCLLKLDLNVIDDELKNNFNTKGSMMEQFVAQHLNHIEGHSNAPALYYWLRDKGIQKGEIDFLLQKGQKIIPVEVKSVGAGHLKSVFYFAKEKKSPLLVRVSNLPFKKERIKHIIEGQEIGIEKIDLPVWAIESIMKMM